MNHPTPARAATSTLDELVAELLDSYTHHGTPGPGLIERLDNPDLRTRQPRGDGEGGRNQPGSRPPASLDALHWSTSIKTEAIELDMWLRSSPYPQNWRQALRAIPGGAEATGAYRDAIHTVGLWHSTARTVLGLQDPAREMPHVRCLVCGARSIRCRADHAGPRAWCTNPDCADDDGRPARYSGDRLHILTRNWAT